MCIAIHFSIGGVHHIDVVFRHFIYNYIMMMCFFYDNVGDGGHRDLWEAFHSATHTLGLKAKFIQGLYQAKDICSSLVGGGKLAYAGNGKV